MICPHCGAKIANTAKLCPNCNKVTDSAPTYRRPSGTTNSKNTVRKPSAPYMGTPSKKSKKKNTLLLISAVLGILYTIYSISYWGSASSGSPNAAYAAGVGIATILVMPHLLCSFFAAAFNVIGWVMNNIKLVLAGAVLYAAACVVFPLYAVFVIIQAVLSFVGYRRMKKMDVSWDTKQRL